MKNKQIRSEDLHRACAFSAFLFVMLFALILFLLLSCNINAQPFINLDAKRHTIEVELYDSSGEPFGYSLEAAENIQRERIIFIALTGQWISEPQLKYWLWDLECRKYLLESDKTLYRFIMTDDDRKTMGQCICNINIQLTKAITEYKKT